MQTLKQLVELRSQAFDMANSGKHGNYPLDESFNEDGTQWTALDGTIITI